MAQKDVVLQVSRIESGALDEVKSLYETIRSEKDQAQICLDKTNVFAEAAFLHKTDHGNFLIIHIECGNWKSVQEQYENSDHKLDQLHREVLNAAINEEHWKNDLLTPEFHVVVG